MIQRLISLGHAYEAAGHVVFSVPSDPHYGALSRRDRDAMIAGARVEIAPYKRDPADFVLWKPAGNSAEQVALSFDSPWGRGRPGWHIECSAMIEAFADSRSLTETIDIHGGGLDLIFPHHENEIAQSRCAHGGRPLANYWIHNGFVDMGTEKMSKSLGNVVTVDRLLEAGHRGSHLRYALLSTHYRQPLGWTAELVGRSQRIVDGWRGKYIRGRSEIKRIEQASQPDARIVAALADDLNTHEALRLLNELAEDGHWPEFEASALLLGINWREAPAELAIERQNEIQAKVDRRSAAKASRNFGEADRIRAELAGEGVVLEDGPSGTTWRRG